MGTARITDLNQITGSINPDLDLLVLHDASLPEGQRTVSSPVQKILELASSGLSSGKITLSGAYLMQASDPDVIAFAPSGAERSVTLPAIPAQQFKQFTIFSDDLNQAINFLEPGTNNTLVTLGGPSSLQFFKAYSISGEWYLITGGN